MIGRILLHRSVILRLDVSRNRMFTFKNVTVGAAIDARVFRVLGGTNPSPLAVGDASAARTIAAQTESLRTNRRHDWFFEPIPGRTETSSGYPAEILK